MGNHEFCSRCHASDFHYGKSCEEAYPEKLAQTLKENERIKQNIAEARDKVVKIVAALRRKNIPAELEEQRGLDGEFGFAKVIVAGHHLVGNRRKAMSWTNPNRRPSKIYDGW
jgi:hypothetical protein